jgi:hypothetical protein
MGADPGLINQLDRFRKKRNISDYERAGAVSDSESGEMVQLASNLRGLVEQWLRQNHPALLNDCLGRQR